MSVIDAEMEYSRGDMLAQHPGLHDVYAEIGQLAILEEDWNDEAAPAIDRACILNAKRFVHLLSDAMPGQTSTESAPSVYPTIDAGVQLYWNLRERQVSLTFRPGQDNVEFAEKVQGHPLSRSFVSVELAAKIALQAMNDAL